jgi:hypothetical protein
MQIQPVWELRVGEYRVVYAKGSLAEDLKNYNGGLEHQYDWHLNNLQSVSR